jgi:hypothetical protein
MRWWLAGLLGACCGNIAAQSAPDLVFGSSFETLPPGSCGNGIVEPPETCDLNCPICPPEVYPGFSSSGGPGTCDSRCHVPTQACRLDQNDATCPFVAATAGAQCNAANDLNCAGPGWRSVVIRNVVYSGGCDTVRVYGISAGGSYLFTTCWPPGQAPGTGDPVITQVANSFGQAYPLAPNDDCSETWAIPRMAGWTCLNAAGELRMPCSTPSPGGFIAPTGPATLFFDVTVCPYNGSAGFGVAPFHVWYNAPAVPNPG